MKRKDVMTLAEKRVAEALDSLGLLYRYEDEAVLRYGSGYETVRYPDFYLPEPDLYMEVRDVKPSPKREARLPAKYALYEENGLKWVEIDPCVTYAKGRRRLRSAYEMEGEVAAALEPYPGSDGGQGGQPDESD